MGVLANGWDFAVVGFIGCWTVIRCSLQWLLICLDGVLFVCGLIWFLCVGFDAGCFGVYL